MSGLPSFLLFIVIVFTLENNINLASNISGFVFLLLKQNLAVCLKLNKRVTRSICSFKPWTHSSILPHAQVVELISGGAQIAVTNENKMHYLNLLAQYRLASQVRDEVEHFLKGKKTNMDANGCFVPVVHMSLMGFF